VTANEPAPPARVEPSLAPAPPEARLAAATQPIAAAAVTKIVPRPHRGRVTHKAPATPRRTLVLDPDGTIDPYQ